MKKITWIASVLCLLLTFFPIAASASLITGEEITAGEESTQVVVSEADTTEVAAPRFVLLDDGAGILSEDEIVELQSQAQVLAAAYSYDVLLLTTDNTRGQTSEGYAEEYISDMRTQGQPLDDAFLFLIDMDNRFPYLWWIGNAEAMYEWSGAANTMFGNIEGYLSSGDYVSAFSSVMDDAASYADSYLNGGTKWDDDWVPPGNDYYSGDYSSSPDTSTSLGAGQAAFFALAAGLAAALLTVFLVNRKYKTIGITGGLPYHMKQNLNLHNAQDILTSQNVTTRHIPKAPPPSSHSGGSSSSGGGSHVSSSGSHSGGSGHTGSGF